MDQWIRDYRRDHGDAARWARGSSTVYHTAETEGRIFRMAEQLHDQRDWSQVGGLFTVLHALDQVVDSETSANARPEPSSAAAAGVVGYKILFGHMPGVRDHGWPIGVDVVKDGEAELARIGLQANGFDPIVIDGTDPAAYLWALFEMRRRRLACADSNRLLKHRAASLPRCLALVPSERIRERIPVRAGSHRELVPVGG